MTPTGILCYTCGIFIFCDYYKGDDILAISLAAILLLGLPANKLFEKLKLPGLLGMLILGIIIGPYGINLLQKDIINASADLRKIALIIILLRAGFGIDKKALKKNGITAIKMSFIPAILEGFTIAFISTKLLNFSFIQGGILGFIIAAVSPAVVVPSMLKLIENNIGETKGIPTLILTGASIDDVFAITIFSAFLGLYSGTHLNIGIQILSIPISILLGIIAGIVIGIVIILIGLLGRSIGVLISLLNTDLNWRERLFCIISYTPKATVQAAIGAVPLSLGVESGEIILALAVLSILITAPLGAIGINYSAEKLL